MRSDHFVCPSCNHRFYESDQPFFNGDLVDCPHCNEVDLEIAGSIRLNAINRAALAYASVNGYEFDCRRFCEENWCCVSCAVNSWI